MTAANAFGVYVIKSAHRDIRVQRQPDGDVWVTLQNGATLAPFAVTDVLLSPEEAWQLVSSLEEALNP